MKTLRTTKKIEVRFSEVDPLGIVWHGCYAAYFEDAREAFGAQYELDYLSIVRAGFYTPLVNLNFAYKAPLRYGDAAIVEILYIPIEACKIVFDYRIVSEDGTKVYATGRSEQVFLCKDTMELQLFAPDYYVKWKEKYLM